MAGDYGPFSRLLHRLALGSDAVAEMSFGVDQALARKPGGVAEGRHVFVSGLARAGTTVLMRQIHNSGDFRSLTYADMPFVLAPNFWSLLRGGRTRNLGMAERAHGDGVLVDADSPESLEEAFWRVFDGASYIHRDHLVPHEPNEQLLSRYRDYIGAILATAGPGARYLAKNNNNILRLGSLQSLFPNAVFLIPFRWPLDQAASLLTQHQRFVEVHASDRFTKDYMGWLVHHEFGADHRAFGTHPASDHSSDALAYWVDQWLGVYRWLLDTAPPNAVFVCYEDLCTDSAVWGGIAHLLELPLRKDSSFAFTRRRQTSRAEDLPGDLRRQAESLYEDLRRHQVVAGQRQRQLA